MRKSAISAMLALTILIFSVPSQAKLVFLSGTVLTVFVGGVARPAESVTFIMSFAPQTTGCTNAGGGNQVFVFDPTTITDAQTRKDILALIMASRTSGVPLTVDWDDAGAHCAGGFPVPLNVGL